MAREVYHAGMEVDVLGGSMDERWAIVRHEDGQARDVDIAELKADGGIGTITEKVEARETFMGESFDQFLPLQIRYPNESLKINTGGNTTLFDAEFFEEQDRLDGYEFVAQTVMGAIRTLDMAHRQPRRLLFRNREKLESLEVEA